MDKCLQFHRNNKWIRPNIQCTDPREKLTEEQYDMINHALICCYKKRKYLFEFIKDARDRLYGSGMSVLITKKVMGAYGGYHGLQLNASS